jgi:hypothetical protein
VFRKIQQIFRNITDKIENNETHFGFYVQLFIALLCIRLTLEFISNQRLFNLLDIIHIGLWFLFIVVAFILQLHLFSGENMLKVARLSITSFAFSFSAPLIDSFFINKGFKMNYLAINNWSEFAWSYFTIGGMSLQSGATIGIRIEIVLLLVACFNYIIVKKNNLSLAFLATFSIYTILFLAGAIPFFIQFLVIRLQIPNYHEAQPNIVLFLSLNSLLIAYALYRYCPSFFSHISFPIFPIIAAMLCFYIGVYQANLLYPANWELNITTIFHFPLLVCISLLLYLTVAIHQKIDTINFNIQFIKLKWAILLAITVLSFAISYKTMFATLLSWAILFILYEQPLRLIEYKIVKNILLSFLFVSFSFIGFCSFGGVLIGFPVIWALVLFVVFFLTTLLYNNDYV